MWSSISCQHEQFTSLLFHLKNDCLNITHNLWPYKGPGVPLFVTYLSPAVFGSFLCFFPERTLASHCTVSWPPQTSWIALCAEDKWEHKDKQWEYGYFRLHICITSYPTTQVQNIVSIFWIKSECHFSLQTKSSKTVNVAGPFLDLIVKISCWI